ncbi:hypothetical protein [Fructobacillus ficulneus]|uniref:Uncharacterized protein n=1 Tax=Fructobacillus ficulneus TaxID=157463 RepID=A0A0K8MHK8_9LACO|nr:hypothetical protein [Fructobacillus ficulneus]GAP00032.1 hypothetical protein FFIC_280360 [Fructobacillus ficulneus]
MENKELKRSNKPLPKHHHWVLILTLIVLFVALSTGAYALGKSGKNTVSSNKSSHQISTQKSANAISQSSSLSDSQSSSLSDYADNSSSTSQLPTITKNETDYGFKVLPYDMQHGQVDYGLSERTTTTIKNIQAYIGHSSNVIPMTSGTINPPSYSGGGLYPDGVQFWHTQLTIDGTKQNVVAAYARQGFFQIFTAEPTDKNYCFTYNGTANFIGSADLDSAAQDTNTTHYYDTDFSS